MKISKSMSRARFAGAVVKQLAKDDISACSLEKTGKTEEEPPAPKATRCRARYKKVAHVTQVSKIRVEQQFNHGQARANM